MINVNILLCAFVMLFDLFHLSYQVRMVGVVAPPFRNHKRTYVCMRA
jgi:hypothetical protein